MRSAKYTLVVKLKAHSEGSERFSLSISQSQSEGLQAEVCFTRQDCNKSLHQHKPPVLVLQCLVCSQTTMTTHMNQTYSQILLAQTGNLTEDTQKITLQFASPKKYIYIFSFKQFDLFTAKLGREVKLGILKFRF